MADPRRRQRRSLRMRTAGGGNGTQRLISGRLVRCAVRWQGMLLTDPLQVSSCTSCCFSSCRTARLKAMMNSQREFMGIRGTFPPFLAPPTPAIPLSPPQLQGISGNEKGVREARTAAGAFDAARGDDGCRPCKTAEHSKGRAKVDESLCESSNVRHLGAAADARSRRKLGMVRTR